MEQTKEETADSKPEQVIEENVAWEEWSIIDDGESSKNHKTSQSAKNDDASSEESFGNIDDTSDAEEARECVEVLSQENLDETPGVIEDDNQGNEESDGVSVITESDAEEPIVEERKVIVQENETRVAATKNGDIELNNLRMIFLVVSSLLGLAILCIAINSWTRKSIHDLDDGTETKCSEVYELIKESADASEVARKMKFGAKDSKETPISGDKVYIEKIDSSVRNPENEIFKRLQVFQHTMCSLLEDVRYPDETRRLECERNSLLPELMSLRSLYRSVLNDMNTAERASNERLLKHVEFQIESMSDSLSTDFARALDKLTTKNEKKIEKLGVKLAERLCVLRNTLPSDNKHRESLEQSNSFVENCDEIAPRKIDERRRNGAKRSNAAKSEKYREERQAVNGLDANDVPRVYKKRRNDTVSREASFEKQDNLWDAGKSHGKDLPSIPDQNFNDTCAALTAPPKPSWKMKRKTFSATKQREFDRNKANEKYPGKTRTMDEREAPSELKTKASKEVDEKKDEKPNTRRLNKFGKMVEEANSRNMKNKRIYPPHPTDRGEKRFKEDDTEFILVNRNEEKIRGGPNTRRLNKFGKMVEEANSRNMKNKRIYPPHPTDSRGKKRLEKEDNEFILLNMNEDETFHDNGHWQFDRSQFRDQLRKDESTSNWYFERVGSRKSSRLHCDGENQDPRCFAAH